MLWHLCDISCHNIERICAPQVLFLWLARLAEQDQQEASDARISKDGRLHPHEGLRQSARLLRRQAGIQVRKPRSICPGYECWRTYDSHHKSPEFHTAAKHHPQITNR